MFFIQLLLLLKSSRKGKSKDFKNNLSRSSHSWLVDDFSSVEWMSFITRNKIELLLKCLGGEEWWVLKFRRITFGSIHFWQTWARFRDEKLEENRQKYWMFLLLPSLKDWAICHFTSYLFFFYSFASFHPSSSQSQIERNVPSTAFFLKTDQFCSFVSVYFFILSDIVPFFIHSVLQSNLKITTYNKTRFDLSEYEKFN